MALATGARLGPYEVLAPIGAGGMGEVYRARDARLNREVAVKILPASFLADADRLRRFQQEARTVSQLNHPNVLSIYDVGEYAGGPYLVTELLQGETLRERLRAGALPQRKTLEWAAQMARGLAAAHAHGIIHRDLKPENVFLTKEGQLKILDFGLAKLTQPEPALMSPDQTPTLPSVTESGVVLGTAGYMSPEQVRGRPADARADIFSFGAVLYEMLSGRRGFRGETHAETMTAILREEPPEFAPELHVPASVERLVRRCLEKDPEERFQSARDLAFAVESLCSPSQSQPLPSVSEKARRSRPLLLYAVVALLVINAGALLWWLRTQRAATQAAKPLHQVTFDRLTDFVGIETSPAISPDGKSVAFVSDLGGRRQIWVHLTAGGAPLQLTHDASEHLDPRWSQDSASILYYSPPRESGGEGALWEISALGGAPRKLATSLTEADVSHDGARLAFFRLEGGQMQLVVSDRDGSNAQPVGRFSSFSYAHPRWSPDDRWIAYDHATANWADDIYVIPTAGGEPRQVTQEGHLLNGLAWLPDGSGILYSTSRSATTLYLPVMHLWSQPLAGGPPKQLTFGDVGYDHPDVGRDGRVVVARWRMQFDIWKFPVEGDALENARRGVRITAQTGQVQTPTVAPDESQVAFLSDSGGHGNIWVKDLKTGELRQITHEHDPGIVMGVPVWSPDGTTIAFASSRSLSNRDVSYRTVHPDGSDLRTPLLEGSWATWSPDGRWLYYSQDSPTRPATRFDIMKVPAGGGTLQTVRTDGGISPMLSPDGSTLYYVVPKPQTNGLQDFEVRQARPESAPSTLLLRIAAERLPVWQGLHPESSHNGKWLALTLNDSYGTNLWLLSTADGKLRRAVDFGERRTFIARRVSWSPDDRFLYAAVGEGDADIASLDGLLH